MSAVGLSEVGQRVTRQQRELARLIGEEIAERVVVPVYEAAAPRPGEVEHAPIQQLVTLPGGTGTSASVYTIPGDHAVWPLSVICRLTTSSTVADRSVALEYRDGIGTRYLVAGTQAVVQASGQQSFCWHPQAGEVAWPIEDAALAPLPQQHLYPGSQLALVVWQGQTGDVLDQALLSARFDPIVSPEL